jgi:hypothetical protein
VADVAPGSGGELMNTYEFIFTDGTKLRGQGEDPATALLDAQHKAGFQALDNFIVSIEKVKSE